jgi:hypothetical protein
MTDTVNSCEGVDGVMVQVDGPQGGVVVQPGAVTVTLAQVRGVTFEEKVTVKFSGGVGGDVVGTAIGAPLTGGSDGVVGLATFTPRTFGDLKSMFVVVVALIGVPAFGSVPDIVYLRTPLLNPNHGRMSRSQGPGPLQKLNADEGGLDCTTDQIPLDPAKILPIVTSSAGVPSLIFSVRGFFLLGSGSAIPVISRFSWSPFQLFTYAMLIRG